MKYVAIVMLALAVSSCAVSFQGGLSFKDPVQKPAQRASTL